MSTLKGLIFLLLTIFIIVLLSSKLFAFDSSVILCDCTAGLCLFHLFLCMDRALLLKKILSSDKFERFDHVCFVGVFEFILSYHIKFELIFVLDVAFTT